jgi:hypothetical protein
MKLLCAVWIGDERYGNERNEHKKWPLSVRTSLRLREHDQRSELQQVRRAPRQRREQRASTDRTKELDENVLQSSL